MPRREADKIDKRIGENLYRIRTAKGLSREKVGAAMQTKISSQAFIRYEDGSTRIPAASLVELAWILGIKLDELIEGVAELLPSGGPPPLEDRPAVANLCEALSISVAKGTKP